MSLKDKNAVIYGEGGAIGGAVARAFAREGARVFLTGRTLATIDRVAEGIRSAGGVAETARVDALDEQAVEKHIGEVVEQAGSVDVSFNAISIRNVQLIPLVEMPREDFVSPIVTGSTTHLLTARAAERTSGRSGGTGPGASASPPASLPCSTTGRWTHSCARRWRTCSTVSRPRSTGCATTHRGGRGAAPSTSWRRTARPRPVRGA